MSKENEEEEKEEECPAGCEQALYEKVKQDDDQCTPTKHLPPPLHHSSRPIAAYTGTATPPQ